VKENTSVDPLIVRHEAPLGWLLLNRPQVRNALNLRTWQRIAEGVAELASDDANPRDHHARRHPGSFHCGRGYLGVSGDARRCGAGARVSRCTESRDRRRWSRATSRSSR